MKTIRNIILFLGIVLLLFSCQKDVPVEIQNEESAIAVNNVQSTGEESIFVGIEKVRDIAENFNFSGEAPMTRDGETKKIKEITPVGNINESANPEFYIVNYTENKGFVLISGTKDYFPVLAYSDEGSFTITEDMPIGIIIWLDETKEAIKQSETFEENAKSQIRSAWRQYESSTISTTSIPVKTRVSSPEQDMAMNNRMMQLTNMGYTVYGLEYAYANNLYPGDPSVYQECQSIAEYFALPFEYVIIAIKNSSSNNTIGPLLNTLWHQLSPFNENLLNGAAAGCATIAIAQIMKFHKYPTTYNWNNMPNTTATADTKNLIKDIHDILGSGATPGEAKSAIQSFGYNATLADHDLFTVKHEISNNRRPVYMRGVPNRILGIPYGEGHAWISDGVSTTTYTDSYFVEYLQGTPGSYYYSSNTTYGNTPSLQDPNIYGSVAWTYFYMKWGQQNTSLNGWFFHNDVNVAPGHNYQYNRKNIYVSR